MTEEAKPSDSIEGKSFEDISRSLLKESDRGCAMIAAAFLDEYLEQLIRAYFRHDERVGKATEALFTVAGPLASFWAKIQLAYALGLVTHETYAVLEWIRSIRNQFAHEYGPRDFNDEKIKARLDVMIGADPNSPRRPEDDKLLPSPGGATRQGDLIRRVAFIVAVGGIVGRLLSIMDVIQQGRDARAVVRLLEKEGK